MGGFRLAAVAAAAACAMPLGTQAANAQACDDTDLSSCFTYTQTRQVFDYSVQWVRDAAAVIAPGTAPSAIRYIPHGATAASACGVPGTDMSAEYCTLDGVVAVGQDRIWQIYHDAGDLGPPVVVAHEWGHRLQHLAGIGFPGGSQQVAIENQADCVAGAFARQLRAMGRFSADDVLDLDRTMSIVADWGDGRTHGTQAERIAAAHTGLGGGLKACNSYVPGTPLS